MAVPVPGAGIAVCCLRRNTSGQRNSFERNDIMERYAYLQGAVAIVTGASTGIGRAIAVKCGSYGMKLVLGGRREEALRETAEMVERAGGEAVCCAGDLEETAYGKRLISCAQETFGRLDVLVNNAGIAQSGDVASVTEEEFDRVIRTNVKAPVFLCQEALPLLRESDCATIINICSVVAHKGYPLQSIYAASKHALLGFSKSLANEVNRDNIRVHVISPGGVYTDMIRLLRPELTSDGMTLPEDIADIAGFYLEHRMTDAVVDEIQVHRTGKEPFQ